MHEATGDEVRITIEHKDGIVYTGIALVTEVTMSAQVDRGAAFTECYMPGPYAWSISAEGIGPLTIEQRGDHIAQMQESRTASEWKCDRCGTVWPREENRCIACGFYRSIIYE